MIKIRIAFKVPPFAHRLRLGGDAVDSSPAVRSPTESVCFMGEVNGPSRIGQVVWSMSLKGPVPQNFHAEVTSEARPTRAETPGEDSSRSIGAWPIRSAAEIDGSSGMTTRSLPSAARSRSRSASSTTRFPTITTREPPAIAISRALIATSMDLTVGSTTTRRVSICPLRVRESVPTPASRSATTRRSSWPSSPSNCSGDTPHQGQPGSI